MSDVIITLQITGMLIAGIVIFMFATLFLAGMKQKKARYHIEETPIRVEPYKTKMVGSQMNGRRW